MPFGYCAVLVSQDGKTCISYAHRSDADLVQKAIEDLIPSALLASFPIPLICEEEESNFVWNDMLKVIDCYPPLTMDIVNKLPHPTVEHVRAWIQNNQEAFK